MNLNDDTILTKTTPTDHKRILITLIVTLVIITVIYQVRPFVDDSQFAWISIPTYSILPALITAYASILTVKLYKQKNYQAKAFFLFALGAGCWFIAEQIWQAYDHIWEGAPFPSEADIFYLVAYPFMTAFLFLILKPILKNVSRNAWLFSICLSFAFLIPSVLAAHDDIFGEHTFAVSIAIAYPILSSIKLIPAIVGILYLAKQEASFSWMLILFGFIVYSISDTFFLFAELDGSYFDGHPVDLMFVYSYLLLFFALYVRLKLVNTSIDENNETLFSKNIKFETVNKFGIPLTLSIVCLIVSISLVSTIFYQSDEHIHNADLIIPVLAMLLVFVTIVVLLNRNLSRLLKMRTTELIEQRDNLENLVEEKTQEILKSERLSAIGELSGRLAHDLRNPLSVMKMSVDLLKQDPPDTKISDSVVTNRLNLIEKSIDRISHQVDDVLGYVRNSPLKLTNICVHDILQNSLEKITIPKDVEIKISNEDTQLDCDQVKLDAVFINLIVNSIQAMHKGGKIEINISDKNDRVVLEFIDSGEGIPENDLTKVFEPLFTTKQRGTGLGLASCKNIIEQHQGKISVKNNPTTFTVILPKKLLSEIKNN